MELYSEEIEKDILICILVHDEYSILNKLDKEDFYLPLNQEIFAIMKELNKTDKPINLISVKEMAKSKKMNEMEILKYLTDITRTIVLSNTNYYINKLKNYSVRRQVVCKSRELIKDMYEVDGDEEAEEIKKSCIKKIGEIKISEVKNEGKEMPEVISETMIELQNRYLKRNENKYNTGFFDLDKVTDGLHEQELTIIAARPGVGKTSFALNLMQNISAKGVLSYFVSLEMSEIQLGNRMISSKSSLDSHKLRKGWLDEQDWEKATEAAGKIGDLKIIIDTKSTTIQEIEYKALELKQSKNIELIVIDYLQLLKSKEKTVNREQEVSNISRRLKLLSRDLNIPVIALCQLNRETEKRKRPMLSDLRESGAIEQDADNVIFLYVSEEEKIKQFLMEVEVIIAKQRNGPTGVIRLKFNKKTMTFQNEN